MITPWLSTISAIRIGAVLTLIGTLGGWAVARPDPIHAGLHPSWLLPADDPTEDAEDGHVCEIDRRVA